jgi:site-specific recombinase
MSTTLRGLVFDRIIDEAGVDKAAERIAYVIDTINNLTNDELLERISDALRYASTQMAVRPWL